MMLKNKISSILNNNKILIQNFSYLSVLQVLNLVIPLLVYPYLIRFLGSDVFGLVIFAQAIISYLVIVVSYGFNISGAKAISINRTDKNEVSKIFSSIFFIKLILLLIIILVLMGLINIVPSLKENKVLFLLTLWMCLYDIFFPIWYFQGIEQMKYITFISLVMKSFFLISVFLFIKSPADYLLVPIINIVGTILSGLVAFYIIIFKHKVKIYRPKLADIKSELKSSTPIFLSNVSIQIYVATNKVIVGFFIGMESVTYYDLSEKILTFLRTPQTVLSQAIFPKVSKEKNIKFVKNIFKISVIGNVLLILIAFIFSSFIVQFLLNGEVHKDAVLLLKILLVTIPIIGMSNVFGIQTLIPFGYNKLFSKAVLLSGLFYLILVLIVWGMYNFTIFNVAYITVATEMFVTVYMFYLCKKYKLW
ncbi:MAG: oligosaccharide flippase family protein [Flavobacteriales bacterium]